jgi:hypothetical protein
MGRSLVPEARSTSYCHERKASFFLIMHKKLTFLTIYQFLSYAYLYRGSLSWLEKDLSHPFAVRHFQ